jgi:hypothetical protein
LRGSLLRVNDAAGLDAAALPDPFFVARRAGVEAAARVRPPRRLLVAALAPGAP